LALGICAFVWDHFPHTLGITRQKRGGSARLGQADHLHRRRMTALLAGPEFPRGPRLSDAALQLSLFRWFSMVLQASSASAKVLKGEPTTLIAPRLW
jgi:hypothetical protein